MEEYRTSFSAEYGDRAALQFITHFTGRYSFFDSAMMAQVRQGATDFGAQLPPPMALRMATIICAMLPIMCVYPFLQKYFIFGMYTGSVKG